MNDNEAGWTRDEGPSGPGVDSTWTLRDRADYIDHAWLPPGLEEAIRAAERGAQGARVEALIRALMDTLDEFHGGNTPAFIDAQAYLASRAAPTQEGSR